MFAIWTSSSTDCAKDTEKVLSPRFLAFRMSQNPLSVDPECQQFASLIIKQSQEANFGFSKTQVRNIRSTPRGDRLWCTLLDCCKGKSKLDFSQFCRQFCSGDFSRVRSCFKNAKLAHPADDPREHCFREVWDLCKQVEFTWTDLVARTEGGVGLI